MSIEPILVFAILGYLQKMLKKEGIREDWQGWIKKCLIGQALSSVPSLYFISRTSPNGFGTFL